MGRFATASLFALVSALPSVHGQTPAGRGEVIVTAPAGDRLPEYRDEIEKSGYSLTVRVGSRRSVTVRDARGSVEAQYAGDSPAAFLVARLGLPGLLARSVVQGKRLELALSASREPGRADRLILVVDCRLKPGVHVYAPGVEGYIPIAWTLAPSPGRTDGAVVFPTPQTLHLAAIDETVPAYQNRFRLAREIVISSGKTAPVSVAGKLRYQACDDTMCYIPEPLALRWDFEE